jgi:long-chain acyl-CoA synthetase
MEIVGGMAKILQRGANDPEAVRFHVPEADGGWSQVTWGEVLQKGAAAARWLEDAGVRPGDKVSVYAFTRVEWGYWAPAIEACRAVFVPVYFSNTAAQASYVVNHADAKVLCTEMCLLPKVLERWADYKGVEKIVVWDMASPEAVEDMVGGASARSAGALEPSEVFSKLVSGDEVIERGGRLHSEEPGRLARMVEAISDDDVAAIIYTSGTTGTPKGAMLTVRNLLATTESWTSVLEHAFPPAGQRRDILWLPVSHMSGWGIMGQGTLFDYETWLSDPMKVLGILKEVKPTMFFSVPAYWEKLYALARSSSEDVEEQHAKLRELTGGALKFLLSGGAGLKREVKDFFFEAGIQMIEGYGLTECSPNVTMNRLDDFDFESVGKPVPDVEVRIAEDGEILVKGENIFLGYYKDADATAAAIDHDGWFHTGDLGELNEHGFLRISGRKKEVIVTTGGKKIGPAAIEIQFAGNPYIEHVVLYGSERKYVTGFFTLVEPALTRWAKEHGLEGTSLGDLAQSPAVRALVQEAVDEVNADLASFETIKKFHVYPGHLSVDAGHLTASLKLRRMKVWEDFGAELDALYE